MQQPVIIHGQPSAFSFGSLLLRMIYHYWYHTGESLAIRQMLGHADLPEFVGDIDGEAPYRPEPVEAEKGTDCAESLLHDRR